MTESPAPQPLPIGRIEFGPTNHLAPPLSPLAEAQILADVSPSPPQPLPVEGQRPLCLVCEHAVHIAGKCGAKSLITGGDCSCQYEGEASDAGQEAERRYPLIESVLLNGIIQAERAAFVAGAEWRDAMLPAPPTPSVESEGEAK